MRVLWVQLSSFTLMQLGQANALQFLLKLVVCDAGLPHGSTHLNMQQKCVLLHEFVRFMALILLGTNATFRMWKVIRPELQHLRR